MKNVSFKLIFRSWWRNKTFTIISILSIAVGIACTNLLAALIIHELNIEADNPNKDKLAVLKIIVMGDEMSTFDKSRPEMTEQLLANVSELDKACGMLSYDNATYCQVGENTFKDFNVVEADSTFFQFFPQKLVSGSLNDALIGPDRIVLSESFAKRIFGDSDPIGQTLTIKFGPAFFSGGKDGMLVPFTVSAVVKKSTQAAFNFDVLFFGKPKSGTFFFLLKNDIPVSDLKAKVSDQIYKERIKFELLSIEDACYATISTPSPFRKPNTDMLLIALFSAILILAIACFNYINLSFSRVFKQLYAINVQKLMGAGGIHLSVQLFADVFMTVTLGFLIAQLIQYDLLGIMNRIMSVRVPVSFLYSTQMLPITFGFILILACIPAFYMSRRLPEMSLSAYNNFYRGKARKRIISSLAIVQFLISFVLIISSFTVQRQIGLLYDKVENYKDVYSFSVGDYETSLLTLKEQVAHLPGIQGIALSTYTLHDWMLGEILEGKYETYNTEDGSEEIMEVMGYELIDGLPWREAIEEYANPVYLNRTWAQSLFPSGEIPFGHPIVEYEPQLKETPRFTTDHVIAGVVEDYFKLQIPNSLEEPVGKSIINYIPDGFDMKVRIDRRYVSETINQIYVEWDKLNPGGFIEHKSLYNVVLGNNKKLFELSDLLMMYSVISILLTCFGILGIALYAIEQRTKEIGVRKINGSSTWEIINLINRQFIIWIGIAYVIALPIAWLLINQWMQNFVFKAEFSFWTYILPLLIVVGITLLTVSWHSYKAASGNPVDALRDE